MTKLSPGEGLAAAGLILAGVTLLDATGPGFGHTYKAETSDPGLRAHLTSAELTSSATLLLGGLIASMLVRAAWPLLVAAAAAVFAIGVHECAWRARPAG